MKQELVLKTEKETCDLAGIIAKQVKTGDVLALSGELGAGKTFFTQCVCRHLGVTGYVSSPSFILLNEYEGIYPIAHFDLFRLDSLEEVLEIGLADIIEQRLTIIEWYEIAEEILPEQTIYLNFEISDPGRIVSIRTSRELILNPFCAVGFCKEC